MRRIARARMACAVVLAAGACGHSDRAARDSARHDSMRADSVRSAAARESAAPRVVPYDPSAPGAMRGDAPIRPQPSKPRAVAPAPRPAATVDSTGDPVAVVRDYYAAIRAHDFLRAYRMWEASGQAGARSFAQFEAGFDSTESVDAKVGAPGRVEGAAGSRFVTVPVDISARLKNGTPQRFTGSYTLRRVEAPGASASQRRWHLYAANIRQVQ